jgi:hypothetical protein
MCRAARPTWDCQWIAELHEHGLLRPSFIPGQQVAALRARTRYRKKLIEYRTSEGQRLSKVLEDAQPYRLEDADGVVIAPVAAYLRDLRACGRSATTQRSYGMDLLRWFRFLQAVGIGWDQATRVEARDFISWLQ